MMLHEVFQEMLQGLLAYDIFLRTERGTNTKGLAEVQQLTP